jgi:N-ethylmaleimide reductase
MANDGSDVLYKKFTLGKDELANRFVMAPLTRNRATPGSDAPRDLNAEYYAQRASAGLIVAEATQISQQGKGYAWTPGVYSPAQVAGWKLVTDAVHAKGGKIYLQLWHVGRFSHPSLQPNGGLPVAPSAIQPKNQKTFIEDGSFVDVPQPRALDRDELPGIVDDFRKATHNALQAGFDGVEIHAANGYLLDQFLRETSNVRTDEYGGSVENRLRFPMEVVKAVVEVAGPARTGIRISPVSPAGGAEIGDAAAFAPFVAELDRANLVYIHVIEGTTQGPRDLKGFDFHALRKTFRNAWMVNNGYTREMAIEALSSGYADLVAFGRLFLANPDLVARFKEANPKLNELDKEHMFGGQAQGYTDYPDLETAGSAR